MIMYIMCFLKYIPHLFIMSDYPPYLRGRSSASRVTSSSALATITRAEASPWWPRTESHGFYGHEFERKSPGNATEKPWKPWGTR